MTFPMPTVDEMNKDNNTSRVSLLMLRCLMTSDLGFHYMCYNKSTLQDIVDTTHDFLGIDPDTLFTYEMVEIQKYLSTLEDYIKRS